jgi:hypothetical protein
LNTQFKESFLKDLRAIKDRDLLARVNEIIQTVEKAQRPQEIPTLKKLRGERNYLGSRGEPGTTVRKTVFSCLQRIIETLILAACLYPIVRRLDLRFIQPVSRIKTIFCSTEGTHLLNGF